EKVESDAVNVITKRIDASEAVVSRERKIDKRPGRRRHVGTGIEGPWLPGRTNQWPELHDRFIAYDRCSIIEDERHAERRGVNDGNRDRQEGDDKPIRRA